MIEATPIRAYDGGSSRQRWSGVARMSWNHRNIPASDTRQTIVSANSSRTVTRPGLPRQRRFSARMHAAVERDDLAGQVAVGEHREREVGDLLGAPEAPDGDALLEFVRVAGEHPGVLDQRGGEGVDRHAVGGDAARQVVRERV